MLAVALASPARAGAQTAPPSALLPDWSHLRIHLLAVIDSAPATMLDFRTTPGVRSFAEQIDHVTTVAALITSRGILGQGIPSRLSADTARYLHDKALLRQHATLVLDYVMTSLAGVPEEEFGREQTFAGGTLTKSRWNTTALQHSAWTLGQLVPYLRMNGRVPPPFTPF